jgi:uncharacterized small protein (DUF1192 family)
VARYTGEGSGNLPPAAAGAPAPAPNARAAVQAAEAAAAAAAPQRTPADLGTRIEAFAYEIERLEAEREIENQQRIYGFYVDKQMWTQAAALFTENGTVEVGASGVYVGPERIREYLALAGPEFPQPGRLYDRMQLQPIVTLDSVLERARGRWHLFAQEAKSGEYARWGLGVYENEYVKENGVWKIAALHLYPTMYTPYEDGWGKTALPNPAPSAELPPDRPQTVAYEPYPATYVVPFHYEHPVEGPPPYGPIARPRNGSPATDSQSLGTWLDTLEQRVARLEDADEIERLHSVYGYYLADKAWDDLAGIFSSDGTIEIALRGVYVGQPSVRRNLDRPSPWRSR